MGEITGIQILWIILIGAVPGFLATYLGVGGCFLRIPMMMALLGLPVKIAYFVNMSVIAISYFPGAVEHFRLRHIFIKAFVISAICAAAGVLLGTYTAMWVPGPILKKILGSALALVGIYMLYQSITKKGKIPPRVTIDEVKERLRTGSKLGVLMFVAGAATGLCGFGGGIFYMPILTGVMGYPMHIAIGTSTLQMLPVAAVGATNLGLHGYMNWLYLISIGVVTLFFSWLGARTTKITHAWILRALFGVTVLLIGIAVDVGLI